MTKYESKLNDSEKRIYQEGKSAALEKLRCRAPYSDSKRGLVWWQGWYETMDSLGNPQLRANWIYSDDD